MVQSLLYKIYGSMSTVSVLLKNLSQILYRRCLKATLPNVSLIVYCSQSYYETFCAKYVFKFYQNTWFGLNVNCAKSSPVSTLCKVYLLRQMYLLLYLFILLLAKLISCSLTELQFFFPNK